MNGTFDKRLLRRPVRSRLGKNSNPVKAFTTDLRQKIIRSSGVRRLSTPNIRTDARTILRKQRSLVPIRKDARAVLRRGRFTTSRNSRPVQVSSIQQRNQRRPIRRNVRANIPDLLSLTPFMSTLLPNNNNRNRDNTLVSNSSNPSDTLISVPGAGAGTTLSPIQGFKVEVRNLQASVSLDDVYELFSSIGTLRSCNLVRPGYAEVVYNEASDAKEAVRLYNNRELDNRPMNVTLLTTITDIPSGATRFASRLGPTVSMRTGNRNSPKLSTTRLDGRGSNLTPMEVDMDVVRKALFNISTGPGQRRPVDFNVSLR